VSGTLKQNSAYLNVLKPLDGFRESLSSIQLLDYSRLLGMGIYEQSFGSFYSLGLGCITSFFITAFAYAALLFKPNERTDNSVYRYFFAFRFVYVLRPRIARVHRDLY